MAKPKDYYQQNYDLTSPHSEVIKVLDDVQAGRVLDVGSGRGRNSLFLQNEGFQVDALDHNQSAINILNEIIEKEGLKSISARVQKAQTLQAPPIYNLVISTVVLMFLPPDAIEQTIVAMQNATTPGGHNLIVSAIDCPEHPFSDHQLPFGFGFKRGELAGYYKQWSIERYNEDVGHLHRLDADGNPIALRFATLLAQRQKGS